MADTKLTDLTALTTPSTGDKLYIVDISDTTDSSDGSSRVITYGNFISGILATSISVTGLTASQLLRVNAAGTAIESAGVTTASFVTLTGAEVLTNKTLTLPQINDTSLDHQYIFSVSELSADRTVILPLLTGNDEFVFKDFIQTLTNKTLTSPKIGTGIYDTSGNELFLLTATASAVNELTVANAVTGNDPIISATGTNDNVGIKLTPKGTGKVQITANDLGIATDANIQVNGADPKRALYIPANGMFGATTSGAASGQGESTTNKVNYKVLDFDKDADEYACFSIPAPLYWDLGTVTMQFYWTAAAGTATETVKWYGQGLAVSNDDAIDAAYGTAIGIEDALIATGDVHVSNATAAITIGGTPVAGDNLFFRIYRDISEDTLAADARLIGVRIEFGISKYNDIA